MNSLYKQFMYNSILEFWQKTWEFICSQWFLIAMFVAVLIASFFPNIGASGGLLHTEKLSDLGIFLIFFFQGASLPTQVLKSGIVNIKLHLVIQATTFVFFPIVYIILNVIFGNFISEDLSLGFLYLCALPSTVSSSIAFTSIARGNIPAAIFNATLSSILGIFITPMLISLFLGVSGGAMEILPAILNVMQLVLLPFVLGQLSRLVWKDFIQRRQNITNRIDKIVILILVLGSFSDSVADGLWTRHGWSTLAITMLGTSFILILALNFTNLIAKFLNFTIEERITTIFCGSKKTLVAGMPMAKLLFANSTSLGIIILPIIFYHQIQLIVSSFIAQKFSKRI